MTQDVEKDFPAQFADQVGQLVKAARVASGTSAQKLADECTLLGVQMTRNMITSLENWRRSSVSVPEVLAIATVLKVPPVTLLFPLTREPFGECLGAPNASGTATEVLDWMTGATRSASHPELSSGDKLETAGNAQWEQLGLLSAFRAQQVIVANDIGIIGSRFAGSEAGSANSIGIEVLMDSIAKDVKKAVDQHRALSDGGATMPELTTMTPFSLLNDALDLAEIVATEKAAEMIRQIRSLLEVES